MTKTADEYLDQDIRDEFSKHHSAFRTARALGISLDRVKMVVGQEDFVPDRKETTFGGMGRPELQQFMVARKDANEEWDNGKVEIMNARNQYEAGTHIMCSGRDGDWIILYSIPRAVPQPNPNYFSNRSI